MSVTIPIRQPASFGGAAPLPLPVAVAQGEDVADDQSPLGRALRAWRHMCATLKKTPASAQFETLSRQLDPAVALQLDPLVELQWAAHEPGKASATRIRNNELPRGIPFEADEVCQALARRPGHKDALSYKVVAMPRAGLVSFGPNEQVECTFRISAADYGMSDAAPVGAASAPVQSAMDPAVLQLLTALTQRLESIEHRIGAAAPAPMAAAPAALSAETLASLVGEAVGKAVNPVLEEFRDRQSRGLSGDNITEMVVGVAPLLLAEGKVKKSGKIDKIIKIAKSGVADAFIPGAKQAATLLGALMADDDDEGDDEDVAALDFDDDDDAPVGQAPPPAPAAVPTPAPMNPEFEAYLKAKANCAKGGHDLGAFILGMTDEENARAYTDAMRQVKQEAEGN